MINEEKFSDICRAHLDGIYRFSARDNCDLLVTQLINQYMDLYKSVQNPYPIAPIETKKQEYTNTAVIGGLVYGGHRREE